MPKDPEHPISSTRHARFIAEEGLQILRSAFPDDDEVLRSNGAGLFAQQILDRMRGEADRMNRYAELFGQLFDPNPSISNAAWIVLQGWGCKRTF